MKKIRWGVISTAKIGIEQVIPAMQQGKYSQISAICSRSLYKAKEAADSLGISKAYGSYQELLDDPEVEAVYNPLPNHLHVPWSIKALEAGKHILCEKPIAITAHEAQQLVDAGKQFPHLKLMEAFMYRHHPQWQSSLQLVNEGRIGELSTIQTFFSYYNIDPHDVRNIADIGGGGLLDIGCYAISLSRFIYNAEPQKVTSTIEFDPVFNTDRLVSAIMEFDGGTATFTCGTQIAPRQTVLIIGTEGWIEIEIPFNAPNDRPCRIWLQEGGEKQEILFEVVDQYTIQGDLFSKAILNDIQVFTPIDDALANMKVIDAIIESDRIGDWVYLG